MKKLAAAFAAALPALALATVNVNNAQQSELERTKGLDKVKAKSIIEWRAANGSIDGFAELQQVPGFTPELVEKLKGQVAFSGDPYVPPPKAKKSGARK
jgi:competence ComEA-like helix-hairpin-helix protein